MVKSASYTDKVLNSCLAFCFMRNKWGCGCNPPKLVLKLPPILEAVVFKNEVFEAK